MRLLTRRILIRLLATVSVALLLVTAACESQASPTPSPSGLAEQYRPLVHYTPAKNWMNDPNGLIKYKGTYHLFYQYNATGTTGGNASWGHATSPDLVHWTEQPIAIPSDQTEEVWSGSVVYDQKNTSGLGSASPKSSGGPLVAIYTSAVRATGVQRQSLAYSTDDGATWTKYANNPVLDIGSHNFRDPKVFAWPDGTWRMVVVLSDKHQVAIYSSPDLKSWTLRSTFGPAGVTSAVWECPDLFPLRVDGNPATVKWVMVVGVAGRTEYFVGSFDGSTFTSADATYTPPAGTTVMDFENGYGSWATTGDAFGTAPASGVAASAGAQGSHWADSWGGSDAATGTLTSPEFTINQPYLNFLVGGGKHPHVDGGLTAPPAGDVIADFEGTDLPGWTGTGDFANITPSKETLSGQVGSGVLDTCQQGCDAATGTITSAPFTVGSRWLDLLIAGGNHPWGQPNPTAVTVLVDGQVVASATGNNSGNLDWAALDLGSYQGKQAQVQIVDDNDGGSGWGHLMVDQITLSDAQAKGWDAQTGVNLLVDGAIVRSATGNDSGQMDWASFDLSGLQGKKAQIQVVDRNTGGWGHVLADDFVLSGQAAQSASERAKWIDQGSDFYAAATFNGMPIDQRVMLAWMSNWDYANDMPTSPWRGAQSLPRQLTLVSTGGGRLVSRAVADVDDLARPASYAARAGAIAPGEHALPTASFGTTQRIDVAWRPGSATTSGVQVFADADSATAVGWDASTKRLYLDRTRSGNVGFNAVFPRVDSAPVTPDATGTIRLRIYLDASSVEVFTADGRTSLTDLVFPDAGASAVRTFATGGTAQLVALSVAPLQQAVPGR